MRRWGVGAKLVRETIGEQVAIMARERGPSGASRSGSFRLAADSPEKMMAGVECREFLTLAAYNYLDGLWSIIAPLVESRCCFALAHSTSSISKASGYGFRVALSSLCQVSP